MPQASTAMRTWPRPVSGTGLSTSLKGVPGFMISTALIVLAISSDLLAAMVFDAADAGEERGCVAVDWVRGLDAPDRPKSSVGARPGGVEAARRRGTASR